MLSLLVGTPGAGKTLYAIDIIKKIANNEAYEFKNIQYVYTNISGFKFDLFKDNKVTFDKFIMKNFYEHLEFLFSIFCDNENNDNLDNLLQDYCKQHNLLNAYFIIDEAHNHFDNQDKIKNWWFTYHRHLNHEILLITQNKSLINTQYRNIPEVFIKAQPRSKAISKDVMRYFLYTEYRMTQKFSTTQITVNQSYFDIYKSGNISNQNRVGVKFIKNFIFSILASLFLFGSLAYNMIYSDTKNEEITNNTSLPLDTSLPVQIQTITDNKNNSIDLSDLKHMQLLCSMKDKFCLYKNQKINLDFYLRMKDLQNFQEFSLTKTIGDFYSLDVFVSEDFFTIYNQGVNNEKNINGSNANQSISLFK